MDWLQENGIWIVTWLLMLIGVVGTFLPVIPGQILIIVAAGAHWWVKGADSNLGWWTITILVVLFAISQTMEYVSGAVGSKYFGGSKWGIGGAILGGLVGLFFAPFGLLLGPLIGAFAFEWFFAKKEIEEAARSGVGSAIGTVMGMGIKIGIAVAMAGYLIVDLFWI
ncbi:DUF456 domain-containing protein [Roseibacillus persicicus]|uniref:DUF456 domain-containing protein n=1 Tax=Roseibacillus persicicus TaxID=454148 RepID=A0A918WHF6_9BACT|nr:DUF456 domain-containing protein [Roseibacillus persicicus]GHC51945.1 hypothetical protein GCM10007100_17810 [Roseibacillus persicicus]